MQLRMQAIQRLQAAQAASAAALPPQQNPNPNPGFEQRAANGLGGLGANPLGGNPMGNPLGGGAAPAGGLERFFPGGAPGGGLPTLPLQVRVALEPTPLVVSCRWPLCRTVDPTLKGFSPRHGARRSLPALPRPPCLRVRAQTLMVLKAWSCGMTAVPDASPASASQAQFNARPRALTLCVQQKCLIAF